MMVSLSPAVTAYKWVKVAEFGFLGWWICRHGILFKPWRKLGAILAVPILYESILVVWQFLSQSSIGGIWYFLGERTFNAGMPGIANAYLNGALVLRPYGTFPHPNVLGGFLAVVLPLILALRLRSGQAGQAGQGRSVQSRFLHNSRRINERGILGVLGLGYTALVLSMSRGAIVVGVATSLAVVAINLKSQISNLKKTSEISKSVLVGLVILVAVAAIFIWPRFTSILVETEPITVRERLNELALEQWRQSPIIGVGLGTSPLYGLQATLRQVQGRPVYSLSQTNYALRYQPTHNIYLLVLSETGLVGLGVFGLVIIYVLRKLVRERNYVLLTPLVTILVLGMFDHYFLTVQQGQLLMTGISGLAWAKAGKS